MFRKRFIGLIAALMVCGVMFYACSEQSSEVTPARVDKSPDVSGAPAVGGELVYSIPENPDTLSPFWGTSDYAQQVSDRIYGPGLIRVQHDMKPEPALAEALPTIGDDQKSYTFRLRKGIKFHDGSNVTANDLVFAYQIIMDKEYAGRWKAAADSLESVTAVDEYTIALKTKEVFAPFLFETAMLPPVPLHLFKEMKAGELAKSDMWQTMPVGAGPYKFVEWKSGQYVLLERFSDYWERGKQGINGGTVGPWVASIRVRIIPDEYAAIAALEAGQLSFATQVSPEQMERLKTEHKDKLSAFEWSRLGYGYQIFNNDKFPTDIKEVRQALSYALNRPEITKSIMAGRATLARGLVPPTHWAFDQTIKGYAYDPQKAVTLLEQAGFRKNERGKYTKDGQPLKLKYVASKGVPLIEGIAQQSKKDWEAIGAEVELVMVEFNSLLGSYLKPGDFHLAFSSINFSLDPHRSFNDYHSSNILLDNNGVNQGVNLARYRNPEVDKLIDQGKSTLDLAERVKIYQEAQHKMLDDAVCNWIYINQWTDFANKSLMGVVTRDGYGLSFDQQWFIKTR